MSFARLSFLKGISSNIVNFGSVSAEGIFGQLSYGSAKGAAHPFLE